MKTYKLRIIKIILWLLILGTMGAIFFLSGQKKEASDKITVPIVNKVSQDKPLRDENGKDNLDAYEFRENAAVFIRKSAHVLEYLLLATLMTIQFKLYKFKTPLNMSFTAFSCLLYAVLDEYHQTLVKGRSGELKDVLFDLLGIILGILLTQLIIVLIEMKRKKRKELKASKEASENG